MNRAICEFFGGRKTPTTPKSHDPFSEEVHSINTPPRGINGQRSQGLTPSRSMQALPDSMEIDNRFEGNSCVSQGSPSDRRSRPQQYPDSKPPYHLSPSTNNNLTKNQRRRQNWYSRLDEADRQKEVQRNLHSKIGYLERECTRLSAENSKLRFQVDYSRHEDLLIQLETAQNNVKAGENRNRDLNSYVNEVKENCRELQNKLQRVELENTELLSKYKSGIAQLEEQTSEVNEQLQKDIQQLRTDNEKLRLQHDDILDVDLEDVYKQNESFQIQLRTMKSERDQLNVENQKLQEKCERSSKRWKEVHEIYIMPWAQKKSRGIVPPRVPAIITAIASMAQDSLEVDILHDKAHSAKQQVQALQKQLLSNVEKVEVISDEHFVQQFQSLAASIKTFSRTAIQLSKASEILTIGEILNATLSRDVNPDYWTTSIRKKGLIEAFVWSVLWDTLFSNPFSVLGSQYTSLFTVFLDMYGEGEKQDRPAPTDVSERWRRLTMQSLIGSASEQLITNGEVNCVNTVLKTNIEKHRVRILRELEEPLYRLNPAMDSSKIVPIVDKTFNLVKQMSLQQFHLRVVAPCPGDGYVAGITPEMTSVAESEDVLKGTVGFIVRPGLAKWGDAHGKNLDQRLDLVPSLVFIEPLVKTEA